MNKKHKRILQIALCGTLVLANAVLCYMIWNEGDTAQKNAQLLLKQNTISIIELDGAYAEPDAIEAPTSLVQSDEVYMQPDAPEAQTENEINTLLETELKGYSVIARIDIEKLHLRLPVISETSAQALKISVCYYIGPEPGGEGNVVITGHNYRNGAHFGRLDELSEGDSVIVTDEKGNSYTYIVYKTELIKPDQPESLQEMEYDRELTLMTCEQNGNRRLLVRCKIQDS